MCVWHLTIRLPNLFNIILDSLSDLLMVLVWPHYVLHLILSLSGSQSANSLLPLRISQSNPLQHIFHMFVSPWPSSHPSLHPSLFSVHLSCQFSLSLYHVYLKYPPHKKQSLHNTSVLTVVNTVSQSHHRHIQTHKHTPVSLISSFLTFVSTWSILNYRIIIVFSGRLISCCSLLSVTTRCRDDLLSFLVITIGIIMSMKRYIAEVSITTIWCWYWACF